MVSLTIKTLKNATFAVEIDLSETVLQLKEKISAIENVEPALQKLIHSGKILDNAQKLNEYQIKEKDFVVLMVTKPTKPKPVVVQTPAVATPTPAAAPAISSAAATPVTPVATGGGDSSLATGANYQSAVDNLVEMGFPLDSVKAAMRAAFNNPDRAAEYLMTGIPEGLEQAPAPSAQQPTSTGPVQATAPVVSDAPFNMFAPQQPQQAAAAGASPTPSDFAFLRNTPQFQQLRQLVQTQPQLLQPVLQQLGQSNPQLLQAINQNQDAFLQMLMEGGPAAGVEGDAGGGGAGQPQQVQIQITPEEDAAITRLVGLGFERGNVIEAFFACDKNEELAANYLFDAQNFD